MSKRKPHPSQKELQELFFYDEETGLLHWKTLTPNSRVQLGDSAGSVNARGYRQIGIGKGGRYQAHNLVWIWNYGCIPEDLEVDHADKNESNNLLSNLRLATRRQQSINRCIRGFSKLRTMKNSWKAAHNGDGREYIGSYPTALQARLAYERYTSGLEPAFASTFFTDAFNRLLAA